jgi:hypothetical protein
MNLKQAFAEKIIPIKEKLSPEDYEMILVAAEDFGHGLLLANMIALLINTGTNIHFYWKKTEKGMRIMWETDNLAGIHIECNPEGHASAEDAMKTIIDTIRELLKSQQSRIIKPSEVN